MGEEFHAVLKLITGEEIFSLVSVDENDGDSIIMLSNPVIMKMLSSPAGKYVKVKPWLELPDQDLFLIKYDKIITMSEVTDEQMIKFYTRYLNEDDIDIEIDGQVTLNDKMGFLSTVEDARKSLENIFKNNIDKPNNPWTSTKVIVHRFHWLVKSDKLCYTIKQKVTPKQGRAVLFDGMLMHTAEQPINNIRCVVNYNLD